MSIDKRILGNFAADIYSHDSLSNRFDIYKKYVQMLGFEGVTYTFVPEFSLLNTIHRAPVFLSSELFPNSFIEQYTYDRMDQNDFTIDRIKAKKLAPMDWQEFSRARKLNAKEENILNIAKHDHAIKNALSIPTMSSELGIAGASIISSESDANFSILKKEKLQTLQICTKLFHDSTVNISGSSITNTFVMPLFTEMKPKEAIILRYFASGKPLKNIYDSTGISYSYAANLLRDLRQRLGGISNEKIMYIIGLYDILEHI